MTRRPAWAAPEETRDDGVLVSATIRTDASPPLASCCTDLGLDFVFAHGREMGLLSFLRLPSP